MKLLKFVVLASASFLAAISISPEKAKQIVQLPSKLEYNPDWPWDLFEWFTCPGYNIFSGCDGYTLKWFAVRAGALLLAVAAYAIIRMFLINTFGDKDK